MSVIQLYLKELCAISEYFEHTHALRVETVEIQNDALVCLAISRNTGGEYRITPRFRSIEPIDKGEQGVWLETDVVCERLITVAPGLSATKVESSKMHTIPWQYAKV